MQSAGVVRENKTIMYPLDNFWKINELALLLRSVPRPFVLINERELSVLRRGLTKPGWKRELYLQEEDDSEGLASGAGVLARADAWLGKDITVPERAGCLHHYYCSDGTRLAIPKPGDTEFRCPSCGKMYSGEQYEAASRYLYHNSLSAAALLCAVVYGIKKDNAYAEKAAEILLAYVEAYPGPHTDRTSGGIFHQSLDEARWVVPLAQAYDLICQSRSLSDADRSKIVRSLFRPVAEGLMNAGIDGVGGSWQLSAVGIVGFATKDAALVDYALKSFVALMTEQLGPDGLWPESVHCHHFLVLSALVCLAEACYRAGIQMYKWQSDTNRSLRGMFRAPLSYAYSDFLLPAIGDGRFYSYLPLNLYEIAYRRFGDPELAWALKTGYGFSEVPANSLQEARRSDFERKSFYALLFGRDMPGRISRSRKSSVDLREIGICTLRSRNNMMATLKYGPHRRHGHRDNMSITLYGANRLLVPDYGAPGCASDITSWYIGTAGHNTVVVDGKDQEPLLENDLNDLLELDTETSVQVAKAATAQVYPGVRHARQLLLSPRALYIVDDLTGAEEHTYDWAMRAEGEFELKTPIRLDDKSPGYNHVQSAESAMVGDWHAAWKGTSHALDLWMWQPDGSVLFTGNVPAETATRRVPVVVSRQIGLNARFVSCLVPHQGAEEVSCERSGRLFKVTTGGVEEWLYIAATEEDGESLPIATDARIACLTIQNEQVVSCTIIGGSYLLWREETVLGVSEPVDQIEARFDGRNPTIACSTIDDGYIKLRTHARAIRLNGYRFSASNSNGTAVIRVHRRLITQRAESQELNY